MNLVDDKNLCVETISGLNAFIDNDMQREAEECVEYFKKFEDDDKKQAKGQKRRSRRREEGYKGWPLINISQVKYIMKHLDNVEVFERDGIFLVKLIRK